MNLSPLPGSNRFLHKNFLVFFLLSEQTSFKSHQAGIVVFLSFVQFLTAHTHAYELFYVQSGTFLDYVITAFSYFDMFNVLGLGKTVFKTLLYVASGVAYLYLLSYLVLIFEETHKIKKQPLTIPFVYCCKYYTWLLFFPSVFIFLSQILCPEHVVGGLGIKCSGILKFDDVLGSFLAISGLAVACLMAFINSYFNYSTWYIKSDYFSTHYEVFLVIFHFLRLVGVCLMVLPTTSQYYMLVYIPIHLFQGLFLFWLMIKFMPFSKFKIQSLFIFFDVLYLSVTFGMLVDYLTHNRPYDNQSNYLFFAGVSFIIFEFSAFSYLDWRIIDIARSPENSPQTFFQLIRKVRVVHFLASSFKPRHLVYFKGILSLHIETCRNALCFCKLERVFDAKKGRELELGRRSMLKGVFAKYLIKNWFEAFLYKTTKDPRPSIFYADFLFNKMKNIHMALSQLALAERRSFAYNDRRKILQFREQIRQYIEEKNSEFANSNLGFEVIVFLEDQLEKLIVLKRRFLKKSALFWKGLENQFLDLTEMNRQLTEMTNIKTEITSLWGPLKPFLDAKKQLRFYYQWYLKNIMNKKLKVADEEIREEGLDEEDYMSVDSKDMFSDSKNEEKLIFQKDCCVLHVKSTATSLANIHKANSGVFQVFEYRENEIIGSEITRLMSPFFAKNHTTYVESFIKNSKTQVLYNMKVAFGMNKSGFIMPVWLVIKQFVDPAGGLEYISMIKPLTSRKFEADYITLNEYGVIDGVSKGIAESLFLETDFVKRAKMNILLLAPKLVKFFEYEKYLKKDEEKKTSKKTKSKKKESKDRKGTLINLKEDKKSLINFKEDKKLTPGKKKVEPEEKLTNSPRAWGNKSRKNMIKKAIKDLSEKSIPNLPAQDSSPRSNARQTKADLGEMINMGMKESQKLKGPPKSEKSSSSASHSNSDATSDSNSEDSKVNPNLSQNVVNFLIKLPKNLEKYVNYYHDLLVKKDVNYSTFSTIKHFSKTLKENELVDKTEKSIATIKIPEKSDKTLILSKKNPIEAVAQDFQFEENCKKELKAIVLTAERISKNRYLNIYKVRAMISTRNYGEGGKDALKVIKIISIQKKVERFNKNNNTGMHPQLLSAVSEEMVKSNSNFSLKKTPEENDKILNLSPTLTNKFFRTRTNTNDLSASNLEELPKNDSDPLNNEGKQDEAPQSPTSPQNLHQDSIDGFPKSQGKLYVKSFQRTKGPSTDNIFLKEDTMKARKSLPSITKIRWFLRLLFVGVFLISLMTYFLGPFSQFQSLQNKSSKIYLTKSNELNVLKSYNVLMNFLFVTSGIFTKVLSSQQLANYVIVQKNDFQNIYTFLIGLNEDSLMKNVLFDPSVFPDQNLNYTSVLGKMVDGYSIQNKDLLFLYIEKLNNVYNTSEVSGIDVTDPDVQFFRIYILPTLIDLLKAIENRLFNSMNTTTNYINDFMLYILIAEVTILCLTFVILLRYILQVNTSFQSIIEVFTYIDNSDVRGVKRSVIEKLRTIRSSIKGMVEDDAMTDKTSKLSKGGTMSEAGKRTHNFENEQQFKKLKKYKVGNFLANVRKKVLFYYFLFIAVTSCLSIGFYFLVKTATNQIQILLENGQTIIGLIDQDSFLLISMKENMYDPGNYQANIYGRIKDTLPNYLELQSNLFLPNIDFASFDQASTSYFYTNPCLYYQGLDPAGVAECNNITLGKLSLGIVSFNNYFLTKISDFLTLKAEADFGNLTANDLYDFDRAIYYTNLFILDILRIWSNDVTNVLNNNSNNLMIYLVFMLVGLIGAFIVAENLVVGKLRNTYKYYRQIYNNFMPTELVNKERLIKARLVIANVVNR